MTTGKRRLPGWARVLLTLVAILAVVALAVRIRYGGGERFPARDVGTPMLQPDALEVVAELPFPPGNIAVSKTSRVFFTFHPDAKPDIKVAELVDGEPRAFPSIEFQSERDGLWFDTPLSMRIDAQGHLWVLDLANHGTGDGKLLRFDLSDNRVIREIHFGSEHAGLGSHLNDFAVHPSGDWVYIAEASIFAKSPALIVYNIKTGKARRVLEGHVSVMPEPYYITVDGQPIEPLGLFAVRPGVDSIALDRKAQWLYFAAVTATKMYRVPVAALNDERLSAAQLAEKVEAYADKTQSDGITTDDAGHVYLSDPEHDAVVALRPDRTLQTVITSDRLRWPDGFSFGPDGWLYVTCSALQHVILKSRANVEQHAPYHIFRFKPPSSGAPGH